MQKTKVMFLTGGGDIGGAKTHILSRAGKLVASHDILLISFRDGDFAKSARECGIPVTVIRSGSIFSDLRRLLLAYDGFKPDIVHCHGAKANFMGAFIKKFRKSALTVTTMHSDYKKRLYALFFKTNIIRCD